MAFSLYPKLEIHRLIEYRVDFILYQRLNASFGGYSAGPPGPVGPSPRAKMLRLIWKRPNPLNIQSNDAFNRW